MTDGQPPYYLDDCGSDAEPGYYIVEPSRHDPERQVIIAGPMASRLLAETVRTLLRAQHPDRHGGSPGGFTIYQLPMR